MWTSIADRLALLEAEWRTPEPRFRNFPLIARYHEAVQAEPAYHRLDRQTWTDLNGDELFGLLDGTVSRVGQQCLYHRLRSPLNDATALREFDKAATFFTKQAAPRGQALLALSPLTSTEAHYLPNLLAGHALPALAWTAAAPALVLLGHAVLHFGYYTRSQYQKPVSNGLGSVRSPHS